MSTQLAIAIAFHQLATLVWVGGTFFAHFALRGAVKGLEPPQRLDLMRGVLGRFFLWVWASAITLWVSGVWIIAGAYNGSIGMHVYIMMVLATIMTVLFMYLYLVPYQAFKARVAVEDWAGAGDRLSVIRTIVLINLLLGLITAGVGSAGRYF